MFLFILLKYNNIISFTSPLNINILWNLGFILLLSFIIQIVSGLFLSFNINFNIVLLSKLYYSNEFLYGWLFSNIHSTLPLFIFILLIIHVFKSLYFNIFNSFMLWVSGIIIFIVFILSSFLGYCCAEGVMGIWGLTIGSNISKYILGDYITYSLFYNLITGIDSGVLYKIFIYHMIISLFLLFIIFIHVLLLHYEGSSNSLFNSMFDYQRFNLIRSLCDLDSVLLSGFIYIFNLLFNIIDNNGESYKDINDKVSSILDLYEYVRVLFLILRSISIKLIGVFMSSALFIYLLTLSIISNNLLGFFNIISLFIIYINLFLILYYILFSNYFFSSILFTIEILELFVLIIYIFNFNL